MPVADFDYSNPLQSANKGIFGQSCVKSDLPCHTIFLWVGIISQVDTEQRSLHRQK